MPTYYFLPDDFNVLNKKIAELQEGLEGSLRDIGTSVEGESNTWHDNFGYEEGHRQATLWSTRLRKLVGIRNNAQIITSPPSANEVAIGSIVAIKDMETGLTDTFQIGSFWILDNENDSNGGENIGSGPDKISYSAPLAQMILGAKVGETKEGEIVGRKKRLAIVKIGK